MSSCDEEFVLANCYMSGPERYFIYFDGFLRYICQLFGLMNQTCCVGNMR